MLNTNETNNEPLIDFNVPPIVGTECKYIKETIDSHQISGDGQFTKKCNKWMETVLMHRK